MRFNLRTDLGGRATNLPALAMLKDLEIEAPLVLLTGGNGTGKSSLLAALRQATSLTGTGLGKFADRIYSSDRLSFPSAWSQKNEKIEVDLAKYAFLIKDARKSTWSNEVTALPQDAVGVLDPVDLGWIGQRVWMHDGRAIGRQDSIGDYEMSMSAMRRSADDKIRSHGQQMTGRLRYGAAWAMGMFDLRDPYDRPDPEQNDTRRANELFPREIFKRLTGHAPHDFARTPERWLLLDEPETGLDPVVFARTMAMLTEASGLGTMRVICVTHSPLAFDLARSPKVQLIDMDGYAARLLQARRIMADPTERVDAAAEEAAILEQDCAIAVSTDRGLSGQGRFTAHEAMSVPYPDGIIAPYGKEHCLEDMNCAIEAADTPRGRGR